MSTGAPLQFKATLTTGFVTITMIFLVFGSVGYIAYGEHTQESITMNLPDDWTSYGVKLALCCALFFTFPVMMVPVYDVLERSTETKQWFQSQVSPLRRCVLSVKRRAAKGCTDDGTLVILPI
jgi:amino acid permease